MQKERFLQKLEKRMRKPDFSGGFRILFLLFGELYRSMFYSLSKIISSPSGVMIVIYALLMFPLMV